MLSAKDNELLTQTGPGTPMGTLLREYWWPLMRADKLERDGAPERVRLMGENYVAFRDTEGKLGLLDEYCPHRRVSLALARNEDCGLRCIMHGWKIDVTGKVVDTPNEVEAGARLERIKARSFPVREAGGMIWTYVGGKEAPPFPDFPFNNAFQIEPLICKIDANWIQVFETLWDPAHVGVLHAQDNNFKKTWEGTNHIKGERKSLAIGGLEVEDTPYGFRFNFGKSRRAEGAAPSWIPTIMPCWIFITGATGGDEGVDRLVFAHTPIDDTHMLLFQIPYNLTQPFGEFARVAGDAVGENKHNFRLATMVPEQNWGQDREAMANNQSFSGLGVGKGVVGLLNQDVAVAESMGALTDRRLEHLGPADHALIKGRQMFLDALRVYQETGEALGLRYDVSTLGKPGGSEYQPSIAAE